VFRGEKTRPNPAPVTSIPASVEERLSPSSSDAQRIIPTVAAAKPERDRLLGAELVHPAAADPAATKNE
jgi:hypothetical protein